MTPNNTFGRHYGPLTIKRPKEFELDFAIEELLKRGYELIKRGFDPNDPNVFNYDQQTKTRPVNYAQDGVRGKYWAIMKKVEFETEGLRTNSTIFDEMVDIR